MHIRNAPALQTNTQHDFLFGTLKNKIEQSYGGGFNLMIITFYLRNLFSAYHFFITVGVLGFHSCVLGVYQNLCSYNYADG